MSAHVLLNLFNKLRQKIRRKPMQSILCFFFGKKFNKPLRYSCLKMVDNDDRPCVYYKLTFEPLGCIRQNHITVKPIQPMLEITDTSLKEIMLTTAAQTDFLHRSQWDPRVINPPSLLNGSFMI